MLNIITIHGASPQALILFLSRLSRYEPGQKKTLFLNKSGVIGAIDQPFAWREVFGKRRRYLISDRQEGENRFIDARELESENSTQTVLEFLNEIRNLALDHVEKLIRKETVEDADAYMSHASRMIIVTSPGSYLYTRTPTHWRETAEIIRITWSRTPQGLHITCSQEPL